MSINVERAKRYTKRTLSRPRQTSWTLTEDDLGQADEYEEAWIRDLPDLPTPAYFAWRNEVRKWATAKGVHVDWAFDPNPPMNIKPTVGTVISWRIKESA